MGKILASLKLKIHIMGRKETDGEGPNSKSSGLDLGLSYLPLGDSGFLEETS